MPDYTKLTITEIEAEISAAQCALEAKKREPDYERFREALEIYADVTEWTGPVANPFDCDDRQAIEGFIAAYPALKRAMEGDKPDGGWIEWNGGECPVPDGTPVEVRFQSGRIPGQCPSQRLDWRVQGSPFAIAAYRVLP